MDSDQEKLRTFHNILNENRKNLKQTIRDAIAGFEENTGLHVKKIKLKKKKKIKGLWVEISHEEEKDPIQNSVGGTVQKQ